MRVAYADAPYPGCCGLYQHHHGDDGRCWNDLATHGHLISRLCRDYPDGWAMSSSSSALHSILPLCPNDVRIGAWCKSFVTFKRGVRPCYAWEPVIYWRGRNPPRFPHPPPVRGGVQTTPKDFIVAPITLKKGLTGAKPALVCRWILDLLNVQPGDTVDDLYPGTGIMGQVASARLAA